MTNFPIALPCLNHRKKAPSASQLNEPCRDRQTLDIPFVFSSNGDAFHFHDRTLTSGPIETEIPLTAFPSPDQLWEKYKAFKGITEEVESVVAQDYFSDGSNRSPRYYQQIAINRRVNEALTAEWGRIDRQNRLWRVSASNSKSGKSRVVPLSDAALDVLDQIGTEGKYEHVFINPDTGKPYTHIRHTWIRIREKAGMPWLRLHDLRHSFASLLVNAGRSLYEVQQVLGHADGRVTQRYAHLSSKTLQDAANSASVKIMEAMEQGA